MLGFYAGILQTAEKLSVLPLSYCGTRWGAPESHDPLLMRKSGWGAGLAPERLDSAKTVLGLIHFLLSLVLSWHCLGNGQEWPARPKAAGLTSGTDYGVCTPVDTPSTVSRASRRMISAIRVSNQR